MKLVEVLDMKQAEIDRMSALKEWCFKQAMKSLDDKSIDAFKAYEDVESKIAEVIEELI